jgi:hypothetical protein
MDLKRLADQAKQVIDERGGTERLKRDAEKLRDIATGPGTAKDKARAAGDALREPAGPSADATTTATEEVPPRADVPPAGATDAPPTEAPPAATPPRTDVPPRP